MNRFSDVDISLKRLPPVYGYRSQKLVPLEKALEPIQPEINDLPYYIKVAKQHCLFPSEHGLTHDQSAAIYIYTMEWGDDTLYRILNKALRSENRQALKIWYPYLKLFDTALDQLPTVKEVIWRGIPLDIGKNFIKNQMITWWSVNSCTSSVDVIKAFIGNDKTSTLFLIEALNGKKVTGYTAYESEDEIILRMGTQFRVKSNALDHPHGSHVVHLIGIDNNNDETLTSTINQLQVTASLSSSNPNASKQCNSNLINIHSSTKWKQNGITIAGENGKGDKLNQLSSPSDVYVDNDRAIYIADYWNHRIIEWKCDSKKSRIVAGGNGQGNRTDQLNGPADVIVDKVNDSFIISDWGNRRVVRWSRRNDASGQTIISDIRCGGLTIDRNGDLYISDNEKNEVRRWRKGESCETIVAGGKGEGDHLSQLNHPTFLFVDEDYSVYVSDQKNHRVMKWRKGEKEGIIVASGKGQGNGLTQLSSPQGLIVDQSGYVYVADSDNNRVMRWCKGTIEGNTVVGGNGRGNQSDQLYDPCGLSFDRQGNLYVADCGNNRIQKFEIDSN